jgi:hypothetical protein
MAITLRTLDPYPLTTPDVGPVVSEVKKSKERT